MHTGRGSTSSPAVCLLRTDLNSLAFCAFGVAPPSLQIYISLHQSPIDLELLLMRTTQSCVPLCVWKHVAYFCCYHNANRQVTGICCIRWYLQALCCLCLTLLYLLWSWCWHVFLPFVSVAGFILRLDLFSCSLGCAFPHDKGVGRPVNLCHKHIPSFRVVLRMKQEVNRNFFK